MKFRNLCAGFFTAAALALPLSAAAEAIPGKAAPAFSLTDAAGKTHTLADYKGEWLVLEWFNKDCPYVKKHYVATDNIPKTQAYATGKGVKWLSVISSAEGKQGYLSPKEALAVQKEYKTHLSAPYLLDANGTAGKAYGAKTTPHIFIINPQGQVVYAGAIDDDNSARPESVQGAKNYVLAALDEALAGKKVSEPATQPYGCSVKY